MKIKVNELLGRKACIESLIRVLNSLDTCDSVEDHSVMDITIADAENLEATLEEYEELLDALLESAEVNV